MSDTETTTVEMIEAREVERGDLIQFGGKFREVFEAETAESRRLTQLTVSATTARGKATFDVLSDLTVARRTITVPFRGKRTYRVMVAGLPGDDDIELGQVEASSPQDAEYAATYGEAPIVDSRDIAFYVEEAGE